MKPDPVAIQIGPLSIYWYGILVVCGALVATFVANREARRRGYDPEHAWNALLLCLIFGIVGARLYHVISAWDYYVQNPQYIIDTRRGGLGIFGAVIGGAVGLWLYTRYNGLSFIEWADFVAPGLPLAQAIGRWGNFFNQELYGYATTLPWGIKIDAEHRLPQFAADSPETRYHPTFLYESLLCLGIAVLLMWVRRRFAEWLLPGDLFAMYGALYGVVRFLTEFQRPDAWTIYGIPTAQWVSGAVIAVSVIFIMVRHYLHKPQTMEESVS